MTNELKKDKIIRQEVRVWCDGCYDMVHFGHANQLRQAKKMGTSLIVGVHNDYEISVHKGPPVFNEKERYRMVRGIKWVDEVIENAPYVTKVETLERHKCSFCVHGNDITLTADGQDTYAEVKSCNRYRECQRTPGVSTTDLVGRMLLLTRSHHTNDNELEDFEHKEKTKSLSTDNQGESPWTRVSRFLPSTQTIIEFADGRPAGPNDKIIYVCGAFDLFHIGHLCFLEEAKKLGHYLIVGIYSDHTVNEYRGQNYPIMTIHERVLSVLAYKPVNEVVIGAPYEINQELIDRFRIDLVVQGSRIAHHSTINGIDCYALPKRLNKFQLVDSGNNMTTEKIIERIITHKKEFETRNYQKERKEILSYKALQKILLQKENNNNSKLPTHEIISLNDHKTKLINPNDI